ncbi:sensor histidine kinase [Sorangium cellulosum]|uniref:histidine kinase n=1 Tax=Sorangium cellulosum TaxID=56 RepID=A0A2L0F1Z6_SORCE|nr:ATP-binding protein [Sorangium cellulosum]AUX45566.1 sensor histidine kinase [Sorangium cellulosum]
MSEQDRLWGTNGEPAAAAAQLAEAVSEAASALSGKLDPQALHAAIAELAARLLGADLALLHGAPVDHAHPPRQLASAGQPGALTWVLDDLTRPPPATLRAAESRRTELGSIDPEACERPPDLRALAAHARPSQVLAAPLLHADRLLGVLTCAFGSRSAPFEELLPRVQALAALFALALSGAERAAATSGEVERRLAAEREWLHSVIKDFPVAIAIFDERGGGSLLASRRCEELCGGPHPLRVPWDGPRVLLCDVGGRPLLRHEMPLMRAARGEGTTCKELWFRKLDGSYVPVIVSAGPIRDARGASVGAVASYEDVTYFRDRERLREEWTSLVAHDLKQPLTAIATSAAMLSRRPERADTAAWGQRILTNVRRLERMAADLLDASNIEARRLSLEPRPADLRALVRAAAELAAAERPGRAVELTADEDVPLVAIDAARIDQVLGNLLTNADKYGDPGAAIRVQLRRRDAEVEIAIENRGPGIPPDELPRLFHRYQRLSPGTSRKAPPGTGLGLYICKGIVEAHGGRIWARSEPNETTSFHVALPLPDEPAAPR